MEKCIECGEAIVRDIEGSHCSGCGLDYSEEDNFATFPSRKELAMKNSEKYYSSGLLKDKKKLGYSESNPKILILKKIRKIWDLIKEVLPEEDTKRIFEEFRDFIFNLYKKELVRTRSKELIIYSVLISFLDIESKDPKRLKDNNHENKIDKYLPVKNLSLIIAGPSPSINSEICVFDVNGNNLSECKGLVSIEKISVHSEDEYGYGYSYGYDSDNGYGYDFGYGYGYGQGSGEMKLIYKITLDTTDYALGTYATSLWAKIGNESFSKQGNNITISAPEEEEKKPRTYSSRKNTFRYNAMSHNSDREKDTIYLNGDNFRFEGDDVPVSDESFFSVITSAVIGGGSMAWEKVRAFLSLIFGGFF